jgi:hypothetical protein
MAFKYKYSLNGSGARTFIKVLLPASKDIRIGDPLTTAASGGTAKATVGVRVLGIVAAIIHDNGKSVTTDGCGGAFVSTYRTASTNLTVEKVSALIDVSTDSVYSAAVDDTLGTTTGSNQPFYMMDIDTGDEIVGQLNETTASLTSGQFFSLGVDPDDTTRVLVKIKESFLLGDSGY